MPEVTFDIREKQLLERRYQYGLMPTEIWRMLHDYEQLVSELLAGYADVAAKTAELIEKRQQVTCLKCRHFVKR